MNHRSSIFLFVRLSKGFHLFIFLKERTELLKYSASLAIFWFNLLEEIFHRKRILMFFLKVFYSLLYLIHCYICLNMYSSISGSLISLYCQIYLLGLNFSLLMKVNRSLKSLIWKPKWYVFMCFFLLKAYLVSVVMLWLLYWIWYENSTWFSCFKIYLNSAFWIKFEVRIKGEIALRTSLCQSKITRHIIK